jgi:cell division protein ZapE
MPDKIKPIILDASQAEVARHFDQLAQELATRTEKPNWLRSLLRRKPVASPKGLYIWGNVGRGKTMLMDRFFNAVSLNKKRRIHFHAFMQDVHAARSRIASDNVIATIADEWAASAKLLCLDEMQVSDIADAMILGRLFEALQARGVVIVTTSNSPPDELYRDGLNRQLFLPFIAKLNTEFEVIHLADGVDYRLGRIAAHDTYLMPLSAATDQAMDRIWAELTDGKPGKPQELDVLGRKVMVPRAAHACARFSFADLCEQPMGAADYLAIARNFRTVFVDHLRVLKASERNEAKRLILAIDTFYDAGTRLVISAQTEPEKLVTSGSHKSEFLRTASRLREMQSKSWWARTI